MNETLRFWVVMAALLSVSLLTDTSAPRWLYAVTFGFVGAYIVYEVCRYVVRREGRGR